MIKQKPEYSDYISLRAAGYDILVNTHTHTHVDTHTQRESAFDRISPAGLAKN